MNKWFVLLTLGLFGMAAYGFRADEWPTTDSSRGVKATAPVVAVRQPNAEQLQAASRLQDVDIQWDQKTGAPLSVRGKLLGTQNLGGKGLSLSPKNDFAADAIVIMDRLTAVYRLRDAEREFSPFKTDSDELGFHHTRMNQMFQGLRVVGGQLIVHFNKSGQAYQVNGRYIPDIGLKTKAVIDANSAVAFAQADLAKTGKPTGTLKGAVELVVYAQDVAPVLAYELTLVYNDEKAGAGNWRYWINANNGAIINRYNDVRKSDATISGSLNSGEGGAAVTVTGDLSGGYYYLRYATRHWRIFDYPNSVTARSATASWGTGTPARSEMSAAYNFNIIQTYYSNIHSRNSYDNSGAEAIANVHVTGGDDNAYWDPDTQQFYFYPGSSYGELTVLDVSAHEFTHAVTEKTADLVYQYESGALNESFSDVFGAIVEFATQPDGRSAYPDKIAGYADWLLAEDCAISTVAMRDMRNPQRYNNPSKYHGTSWYSGSGDNGGVHYNSGVQNHFFYLLCEGGSGTNDGISYNITGLGITNARLIAYRALTVYCTSSTDYSDARTAWISAATDLNSSWASTVQAAWEAVGVTSSTPSTSYTPLMNDFDGDYYCDPSLYHASSGAWYFRLSSAGYALYSLPGWGGANYRGAGGLFDDDWLEDQALYSTSTGYWYILLSTTGYQYYYLIWWGASGATPVCADFDGDWFADPTYYLSGYWYILLSTAGWEYYYPLAYSAPTGYTPLAGDFDGDWYADPTFYSSTSGYWFILLSSANYGFIYPLLFGASGYTPALGDFDGDYRTDPVLRNAAGSWYVLLSSVDYQRYISFTW